MVAFGAPLGFLCQQKGFAEKKISLQQTLGGTSGLSLRRFAVPSSRSYCADGILSREVQSTRYPRICSLFYY
jgi:hypothetical protein